MRQSHTSAFIRQHTRLRPVPLVPEIRLYLAHEIMSLWHRTEAGRGQIDVPPPYWAAAWVGGQAVARYVLDHPDEVAGKRVVDFASGSGLAGIAASRAGAIHVLASDVDPLSQAAVALNAQENRVSIDFTPTDLLDAGPPAADVLMAGDVCYEQPMADRVLNWLRAAHARHIRVLLGDPGREYFARTGLVQLAEYDVPTPRDVEGVTHKQTGVYTFGDSGREG